MTDEDDRKPIWGPPLAVIAKAAQIFREQERKEREFTERYGYIRPPQGIEMGGRLMTVVGGSIFQQTREGGYNVVNLIHDYALLFFGEAYLEPQEAKPLNQRHTALQWMQTYVDHDQRLRRDGNTDPRAGQIGAGAAWFRFAYDLYTIAGNSTLQVRLRERLLDLSTFQAARHELRVAAIFAVAGFDLQYEDETDNRRTHPEFIATDRLSPARVAVEAKSRHRRGVQGFEGGLDIKPGDRVNIRDKVLEAYQKRTDLPLYVFIDVNLPHLGEESDWQRWLQEIDTTMSDLAAEGYEDRCPANIVFFSNDPSHYLMTEQIGHAHDRLWMKHYMANKPRVDHPPTDMGKRILKAHAQRVAPPEKFPEQI
jgi:hypothetical protein